MRLIAGDHAHAAQRGGHGQFVDGRLFVVLAGNHLLVIRIRPLDQPGEHERPAGAKSDVVVALRELDLGIARVEPADLLERLGGNDEIRRRSTGRRHIHLGQAVTVRRHHAHPVGAQLPEHAVQDRPAFLRRRGKRHVSYQLVDDAGRRFPSLLEFHRGERGKLLAGQAQQFELGATRLDRDARFAGRGHTHRAQRELAGDVDQLLGRQRHGAVGIHLGGHCRAHRDVEIGAGQPQTAGLLRGFHQNVGQHGKRRFGGDGSCHCRQAFLQLFPRNRELHAGRVVSEMRKVFSTTSLYRTTSSSSRHRGYVGDVAKAQPVQHL